MTLQIPLKGTTEQIQAAKEILLDVKGEKQINVPWRACQDCPSHYSHFEKSPIRPKPCPGFWD